MIYTLTLNPALDYTMQVPALRHDDINRSQGESLAGGGKGVNVSILLTRLGVPNTALGFAGGFTGRQLAQQLARQGVACDFTPIAGQTRINVKIASQTEWDFNARGPVVSQTEWAALLARLDRLGPGDDLVLSGSAPAGLGADAYAQILARLAPRQVRCTVDAAGELLTRALPYRPFLIKPNHHELGDLFGGLAQTDEQVAHYAARLQAMGARNVLVSRGEKGALLLDETGARHTVGVAPGKTVSTVGCGDSMVAGFLAGWNQTGDYAHALRLGAACGCATAYVQGLAGAKDVERALTFFAPTGE